MTWEAAYDSATFTPHLIGRYPDEQSACAAAEAWYRAHCAGVTGLTWTADPQLATGDWESWLALNATQQGLTASFNTEIVVRSTAHTTS